MQFEFSLGLGWGLQASTEEDVQLLQSNPQARHAGPNLDFINSMAKKYLGMDKYSNHQPGDERVVNFVCLEHTTGIGG